MNSQPIPSSRAASVRALEIFAKLQTLDSVETEAPDARSNNEVGKTLPTKWGTKNAPSAASTRTPSEAISAT